jgi:hypothetical protein
MNHLRTPFAVLALLAPLAAGCGSADVQVQGPPPPQVDVQGQVGVGAAGDTAVASGDAYEDTDPAALSDFHPTLDSHGTWVDDPTYGTVWVPSASEVGPDFTPYSTAGHWVYDNDDYTWVSDYDWGWAPFHYGRWVMTDGRGWGWIPGREYAGAWVNWGASDGNAYVGWYPAPPSYVWRGGVAVNYSYTFGPRWTYVGRGDVFASNLHGRAVSGAAGASIASQMHPSGSNGGVQMHGHGPTPATLGIPEQQVAHASGAGAASVAKAHSFANPKVAVSMGAKPASHGLTPTRGLPGGMGGSAGTSAQGAGGAQPFHGQELPVATHGSTPTTTPTTRTEPTLSHATPGGTPTTTAATTPAGGSHDLTLSHAVPGGTPAATPQGQPKKKPLPETVTPMKGSGSGKGSGKGSGNGSGHGGH